MNDTKTRNRSGAAGVKVDRRRRKKQGGFYPISVCLAPADEEKLERIAQAFCCDSQSRAGRVALTHWHDHLAAEAKRERFEFMPRPEFAITLSPQRGAKVAKFYFTDEDLDRLDALTAITGDAGVGRLVRAAVGWYVEHLNA